MTKKRKKKDVLYREVKFITAMVDVLSYPLFFVQTPVGPQELVVHYKIIFCTWSTFNLRSNDDGGQLMPIGASSRGRRL